MSLPHAILGFLDHLPMTGYDLKTGAFDGSVAHFWPAAQPQIYRELDRLARRGWAEWTLEIQEGRPNRKVYTITGAGRAELDRWLRERQPPPTYREPFLIQIFFGARLSDDEMVALLEDQRRAHEEKLEIYQGIDVMHGHDERGEREEDGRGGDDGGSGAPGVRARRLMRLTLEFGMRLERLYLAWIDDAIAAVRAASADSGAAAESTSPG